MKTPVSYSPTLGALIDTEGNRLAVCESDSIGHAIAQAVNTVMMVRLTRQPVDLIGAIGLAGDPMSARQIIETAFAIEGANP